MYLHTFFLCVLPGVLVRPKLPTSINVLLLYDSQSEVHGSKQCWSSIFVVTLWFTGAVGARYPNFGLSVVIPCCFVTDKVRSPTVEPLLTHTSHNAYTPITHSLGCHQT